MRYHSLIVLVVSSISVCRVLFADETRESVINLSLPDLSWSLEITEPGFVIEDREIAPSGKAARFQAANKDAGIILSAFLEKAAKKGDSKACRDYYWNLAKKSPFKKEQIKMSEVGPFAIVEYLIPEVLDINITQKNLNAYLAEGGYWIDIHISQSENKDKNKDTLIQILKNIRINKTYTPTVREIAYYGSYYYHGKDYKKAIVYYAKALEFEKQKAVLPRDAWKSLVVRFGISYGISGDLDKAKQLFEWAITQEPEYPLFYYNLACAHAELGNRDEALQNLRMAFKYKANTMPGESLDDPKKDSSFKKYLNDKEFMTELDKMK
jgi:tetratricopeptide (TPR) repeat protein